MSKTLATTRKDCLEIGDKIEAIIGFFKNKPQIPAEFFARDKMTKSKSVRFFNLSQSAPIVTGEAWLLEVINSPYAPKA